MKLHKLKLSALAFTTLLFGGYASPGTMSLADELVSTNQMESEGENQNLFDFVSEQENIDEEYASWLGMTLLEAENLFIEYYEKNGVILNPDTPQYLNDLNGIDLSAISIENSKNSDIITAYIIVYKSRVASENKYDYLNERLNNINKTFNDIKEENMNMFYQVSNTNEPSTYTIGNLNLGKMQDYAKAWSIVPNPGYRYFTNGDCTNFASQIVRAGGMGNRKVINPYSAVMVFRFV